MSKEITNRNDDYSQWYNDLVIKGGLADYSAVRGCMVIKPYGFAIWELMQSVLDQMFKETGHQNAYFPLFIPKSFLAKEAAHVEGFAKECAVVTHYRLKYDPDGKGVIVDPDARLEEELIVRPTSETIIWNAYKGLDVYASFAENWMALPVIKGVKTVNERFAGAEETFCIEALVQDGKAIQAGTSHFLGQNFAKAFDVTFTNKENLMEFVWATSWGVSTRLIGTLIMAHSDDRGLILPPKLAPIQVVIIPIVKTDDQLFLINEKAASIQKILMARGIRVKYDNDDKQKPGWKFAEYELKGVPIRIAMGPRDLENGTAELARRDTLTKSTVSMDGLSDTIVNLLEEIQQNIYNRALTFRDSMITMVNSFDEFKSVLDEKGGFISAHWDGTSETENKIKEETKATIRCIPLNNPAEEGACVYSGNHSSQRVLFARAY